MAKRKKRKKSKKGKRKVKGHIPLNILERRLHKLNRVVGTRGGKYYR